MNTNIESNFESLFDKYYDRLCLFLNMYTKDVNIIEDVIQDVFVKLWTNRDFIDVKYLRSYLYASTRNELINHLRKDKLHLTLLSNWMDDENQRMNATDCIDREEFQELIELAMDNLPPKCKHVFKMSRYKSLSNKEIAKLENISEKMVEKHLSTAIRKIRAFVFSYKYPDYRP